ncbi:MAG TPA: MYXO-CTERM sorting domain-containing protein [Polyangia bacterium]|jgi:photosystem II stability/assembly factor-like uncharacterized protein
MAQRALLTLAATAAGLLAAAPAHAGWALQSNGTGQDQGFFQVSAFDAQHAMAVGTHADGTGNSAAVVAVTSDGQTWTQIKPVVGAPSPIEFYTAVRMVSPTKAFVGGMGRVYITSDGGATWTKYQEADWGPLKGPLVTGISFAGAQTGVLVGSGGVMRKTTDGGATWSPLTPPIAGLDWSGVFMRDATHLWAWAGRAITDDQTGETTGYEDGALARSTDGGATWKVVFQGEARAVARVFMINDAEGTMISNALSGPRLEHTSDGGATWTPMTIPAGPDAVLDIFWFDVCEGIVLAEVQKNTIIGYTTDRGVTWTAMDHAGLKVSLPLPMTIYARLLAFDFPAREHGFAGGGFEALAAYTADGAGPGCGGTIADGGGIAVGDGGAAAGGGDGGCGCRAAGTVPSAGLLALLLLLLARRRGALN